MPAYSLRQLRTFVSAVELSSVAETTHQLKLAKANISATVKELEDGFDIQLFIRNQASGVSLTPAGVRFYRAACDLLRQACEFEHNASAEGAVVSGKVEVGCFETAAPMYLPRILSSFGQRYPGVKVRLQDGEQHDLVAGLMNGRFDLAILFRHELGAALEVESLMRPTQPHVLLPQGHRLAAQDQVSLHDLVDEPMIELDVQPSRNYFLNIFQEFGLCPNVAMRSPSIEMVRGLVGQGFGFALLVTRPFGDRSYDGQLLVTRPLLEQVTGSELVIASLRRHLPTRPAQIFRRTAKRFCVAGKVPLCRPWIRPRPTEYLGSGRTPSRQS